MVASGVSGNVVVLHPGGASSLRAQSVIGARLSSLCRVPLLTVHSRTSSIVPVVIVLSSSPLSSPSSMSECHRCFWMPQRIPQFQFASFLLCYFSVLRVRPIRREEDMFVVVVLTDGTSSSANTLLHNRPLWLRAGVLFEFVIL